MPTGSFIPKFYLSHKNMPLSIYIAWWIFGFNVAFYGGRTFLRIETNRKEFLETVIVLWHGRNPFWHPERGNFTENVWKIAVTSSHWVVLANTLEEHGFPWAAATIVSTDVIQCQDALIEGCIFGIRIEGMFS